MNKVSIDTFWTKCVQNVTKILPKFGHMSKNVSKMWLPVKNVTKKFPKVWHLSKMWPKKCPKILTSWSHFGQVTKLWQHFWTCVQVTKMWPSKCPNCCQNVVTWPKCDQILDIWSRKMSKVWTPFHLHATFEFGIRRWKYLSTEICKKISCIFNFSLLTTANWPRQPMHGPSAQKWNFPHWT